MDGYLKDYVVAFVKRVLRENPEAFEELSSMINENECMEA
jgi:hypothetical protein